MRGTSGWEQQSNHIVGLLWDTFHWASLYFIIALPSPSLHIQCLIRQKRNYIQSQDGEMNTLVRGYLQLLTSFPFQVLLFNSAPPFISFQSLFLFFFLSQKLANKTKSISCELVFLIFSTFILISFWRPEEITSALSP